ncbi:MAG TPA: amino acid permease [Thermoleophilia bacterium]|nr:amino acid permease [Thermoleophilia bacterium]
MSASPPVREELDQDTKDLHSMGYAQELDRSMSKFSNFAVSFTIISILSGCLTLYGYGLLHGGPPVMLWGWLLVGTLVIFAGMSLGEICSAFPTAGGLYYWSAKLAPGNSAPIWSWFTGWFNLLGQVAVTAGISFGCAFSISAFFYILTGSDTWLEPYATILILAVVLFLQGLLNTFSVRLVALLNDVSVYWHLIGVAIIFVLLFWAPESGTHQSINFLFGADGWNAFEGLSGFTFGLYVFLIGLLNAQYTFTGYDASAHVSEETINARISAPKGIVNSIWISMVAGFILLLGVSMAIPTAFPVTINGVEYAGYDAIATDLVPWATIFEYATGHTIGLLLVLIVIVAQFFCGMSSITANSRMVYAFARDGAVPFSDFWHHVSKRQRVPVRTAWFGAIGAFILALPYLYNVVAYAAVTSIAVIGLYISYLTPVFLRRINPGVFEPGPWKLSKTWGPIINWIAIIWVVFIVILLMLPQYSPGNTVETFNYAPVAVLVVVGGAGLWFAVSARKWFKGPKVQGTAEELAEIERDLNVI